MRALQAFSNKTILDDSVIKQLVKDLSLALITADVNVHLVKSITSKIQKIQLDALPKGGDRRKFVKGVVVQELLRVLGGANSTPSAKRTEPTQTRVVLMVGLNGAGKTTTCSKYAYHYKKRGLRVGLVACDTFRAGAIDQLKQNALQIKVPFYGSYTERDPVAVARDAMTIFREDKTQLIVIDSAGRASQDHDLLEELQELVKVVHPDEIIYVVDASIGQTAGDQAKAFRARIRLDSVIITKMDGSHAKGGGALSAVAETKTRVSFIGTGEHMDQFEVFEPRRFVQRLLGMGDLEGVFEHLATLTQQTSGDAGTNFIERLLSQKGNRFTFTFRDFYEQVSAMKDVSMEHMMSLLPNQGREQKQQQSRTILLSKENLKRCLICVDSMTETEKDSDAKIFSKEPNRMTRIRKGSGSTIQQVEKVFETFKLFAQLFSQVGPNLSHLMSKMPSNTSMMPTQSTIASLQNMMGGMPSGTPTRPGLKRGKKMEAFLRSKTKLEA